ncbi:APA family basic amino acid/polyamine antiporter [Sphingomonas sp. SORGH_AS 950]|uniref:amino acid permease n=1 Tax=unclassified Sphingomonas TaxID=196159 RepID=UPI002785B536|nr:MULTISPECIES: amino acid permease [unclassified Sphingomonas]MDQ1158594.1 APA family basic amino acid/polyamine antiporter [Sphingomonas sp. SORGH_AS_0950]MDR6113563.1 APA family basic amino acid/polyamine antiporter [Sphingomonas sp. SORGH_AS_0789]MDR6145330.1 APA family basic amino acid/polyamine antiporter [Sphingomonas sp. SORGH_AS_0870]MDR6149076.1 APA family basic amino acid/polyamine antiporter [Sphingomonas sp. SORGH_AS_0742]
MIFGRVKPLDAILATAEKKGLQRSLGAFQLTMLGIGAVIGTGIFVLTSEAAQKAGPGMMLSFVLAGFVCAVAALCYSELASMVPVAGSAYTYTYAVMGELLAWMVGWALILEYAVGASAVAVGWSGYVVGQIRNLLGIDIPMEWVNGPSSGGYINLPAVIISLLVTWLLVVGTTESARVNAILVAIKVAALTLFIALSVPVMNGAHFEPFMPTGLTGVAGAAASIFFAYVGFDAVSTAAEETKNPQRNVPIGLIASLLFCTIFYLLVSAGAIGSPLGAQPVRDAAGVLLSPGTSELADRCKAIVAGGAAEPLSCSREALAHVLRTIGWEKIGNLIGLAATLALPSVVLMMMFGQTRVFFTMARDGLLPEKLASVHPRYRTPHVVTIVTGIAATIASAFLPVGKLADYSNSGTLFAFFMVALSVMVLRRTDPGRKRPFRTPAVWIVAPAAMIGCAYLYFSLPLIAILVLPGWGAVGLLIYFLYSRKRSHVGRGIIDVVEDPAMQPEVARPLDR